MKFTFVKCINNDQIIIHKWMNLAKKKVYKKTNQTFILCDILHDITQTIRTRPFS